MPNTQKRRELASDSAIATLQPNLPATTVADVSATDFRQALSSAITPVTILATDGPNGRAGVTCSAVCSVCDTPPTVLACVNRKSFANGVIKANGVLTLNWLGAEQSELSQLFAGVGAASMQERFAGSEWGTLASGAPYCKQALMTLDCHLVDAIEFGTHSLLFARVIATIQSDDGRPLAYYRRAYVTTHPATC
ncbi:MULTISPECIES: flavin reductase [Paraburkholderia]|uniref:NAD(FAD)-dependent dehydrogenase n=1 Tax=Paraburkholderia youngii TaxID=2782701 RepID=A0A7Y6JV73_9BURK|nr:flavin reductase [Paraburkholderia youngii]NUX99111.1 NAD(FAD)-dependent dehydrogenase [Paraburkholderia youngii]